MNNVIYSNSSHSLRYQKEYELSKKIANYFNINIVENSEGHSSGDLILENIDSPLNDIVNIRTIITSANYSKYLIVLDSIDKYCLQKSFYKINSNNKFKKDMVKTFEKVGLAINLNIEIVTLYDLILKNFKPKIKLNNFDIALYMGRVSFDKFNNNHNLKQILIKAGANIMFFSKSELELGINLLNSRKYITDKLAEMIVIDAIDSGANVIVTESFLYKDILTKSLVGISKIYPTRDVRNLKVLHIIEVIAISLQITDKI